MKGVDGTKVDSGESLTFSMVIKNVNGGAIEFDGFTSVSTSTGAGSGSLLLRDDSSATPGPVFYDGTTLGNAAPAEVLFSDYTDPDLTPTIFTAVAGPASSDNFRIVKVCASFSSVPEPSSLMMFGFVVTSLAFRRKR